MCAFPSIFSRPSGLSFSFGIFLPSSFVVLNCSSGEGVDRKLESSFNLGKTFFCLWAAVLLLLGHDRRETHDPSTLVAHRGQSGGKNNKKSSLSNRNNNRNAKNVFIIFDLAWRNKWYPMTARLHSQGINCRQHILPIALGIFFPANTLFNRV